MLKHFLLPFLLLPNLLMAETDPLLPGSNFILLPAGTFFMGSPTGEVGRQHDERQHEVILTTPFRILATEVTQRQWLAIMEENPSEFSTSDHCPDTFEVINNEPSCPEHPVDTVSYEDVEKFLKKLNKLTKKFVYDLPTEAQWEYAARTGTSTRYYFGDSEDQLHLHAWYDFNSFDQTHQSAQLKPNAWGLFDMYGNVMEWTRSWFYPYPKKGSLTDPVGPKKGSLKSIRGGAFNLDVLDLRSATRHYIPTDFAINQFGFRIIRMSEE